jgi:hypothetical protein
MRMDLAVLACGFLIAWSLRYLRAGRRAESWFNRLANRKILAVLICAGTAMLPRLALLPWIPARAPAIMDEFSYILGAQTLAAGRSTNPTPLFWTHFESFHINMVPSYQSMYPPGPGLFYALGILVGGNPWWGLWLSTGLMCAGICWALQPLIRPRHAFLAGIFCGLKYGVFSIFSDWYLGGAVAAFGGALALGAFLRLVSGGKTQHVAGLVAGVAILANSRPFEGSLFSLPLALATLIWILRNRRWRALVGSMALLAALFAMMGYYNWRGTGSALKMPYMANFEQYHYVMPLLGMGIRPLPIYRHPDMGVLYEQLEGMRGRLSQTISGVLSLNWEKFQSYYSEHFAPVVLLVLLGIAASLRSSRRRVPALALLLVSCGLFCTVYRQFSAYPAPMLVSYFGLGMIGIRRLNAISIRGRRLGPYLGRGITVVLLLYALGRLGENTIKGLKATAADPSPWNQVRTRIIEDLEKRGGNHLVLVKYLPGHNGHEEWVYNSPDIDRQRVILARSMSDAEDHDLARHYQARQAWVLELGTGHTLRPVR